MGGRLLFGELTFALGPGVKLGVLGSNGSGKSTLLRILAGEIEQDAGEVRRAEGVRIAWFDQNRDKLDLDQPLRRALAPEGAIRSCFATVRSMSPAGRRGFCSGKTSSICRLIGFPAANARVFISRG